MDAAGAPVHEFVSFADKNGNDGTRSFLFRMQWN